MTSIVHDLAAVRLHFGAHLGHVFRHAGLASVVAVELRDRVSAHELVEDGRAVASAMVAPIGLEVFPRVTLTAEEKAARLEALVRRMPLGEQLLQEALGTKR